MSLSLPRGGRRLAAISRSVPSARELPQLRDRVGGTGELRLALEPEGGQLLEQRRPFLSTALSHEPRRIGLAGRPRERPPGRRGSRGESVARARARCSQSHAGSRAGQSRRDLPLCAAASVPGRRRAARSAQSRRNEMVRSCSAQGGSRCLPPVK